MHLDPGAWVPILRTFCQMLPSALRADPGWRPEKTQSGRTVQGQRTQDHTLDVRRYAPILAEGLIRHRRDGPSQASGPKIRAWTLGPEDLKIETARAAFLR